MEFIYIYISFVDNVILFFIIKRKGYPIYLFLKKARSIGLDVTSKRLAG
jgi:hypothetical protein